MGEPRQRTANGEERQKLTVGDSTVHPPELRLVPGRTGVGITAAGRSICAFWSRKQKLAGSILHWESQVELKHSGEVLLAGEVYSYGCLVGADGQNSGVRRWVGLDQGQILSKRFGFRQHFAVEPWSDLHVEVHWGRSGRGLRYTGRAETRSASPQSPIDPACRMDTRCWESCRGFAPGSGASVRLLWRSIPNEARSA